MWLVRHFKTAAPTLTPLYGWAVELRPPQPYADRLDIFFEDFSDRQAITTTKCRRDGRKKSSLNATFEGSAKEAARPNLYQWKGDSNRDRFTIDYDYAMNRTRIIDNEEAKRPYDFEKDFNNLMDFITDHIDINTA